MNIDKLNPCALDRTKFERSKYRSIPEQSGCYALTTYEGDILYIGQSDYIRRRFEEHLDCPEKTGKTEKGCAFWFYWLLWNKADLNALERGWMQAYSHSTENRDELPIMNSQSAPSS